MTRLRSIVVGSLLPFTIALPAAPAVADTIQADPAGSNDAEIVFCLAAAERDQLAEAAVALGLARPGTQPGQITLTIDGKDQQVPVRRWGELKPVDFERACAALVDSTRLAAAGSGDRTAGIFALLQVLLGALLTGGTAIVTSLLKDIFGGRRALAAQLDSAMRALAASTERFLAATENPRDRLAAVTGLHLARSDAVAITRRIGSRYPRQQPPAVLEALLTTGQFSEELALGWPSQGGAAAARAHAVRGQLSRAERVAGDIASALHRRAWPWRPATGRVAPIEAQSIEADTGTTERNH